MAKDKTKTEETKEVKEPKTPLEIFLNEHKDDHYNFCPEISFRVSSGSIELDLAMDGGFPPGIHRFGGASEGGKALPTSELVLTPFGWREIGSLKVGDFVIGKNGKKTEVIGVYHQGKKEIFEVEFEDGGKTECCDEHLWETTTVNERNLTKKKGVKFSSVKNTNSIRNSLIYGESAYNHAIPYCDPVKFSEIKRLKVSSYVLGVVLGDGGLTGDSILITNTDQQLVDKVDKILKSERWYDGLGQNGSSYRIKSDRKIKSTLREYLNESGLMGKYSHEKFIPKEYIFNNSVEGRIELLQGLMDTDGYVKPDSSFCQYYTTSPQLSLDVQELVRSLGGRASIAKKSSKYFSHKYDKWVSCKDCWKVNISFFNDIVPVSLDRKIQNHKKRSLEEGRKIRKITSVGSKDAVCIKVAARNGLFVSRDYTVTHNTSESLEVIYNFLQTVPNSKALYVKAEGRMSKKMQKRSGIKFVTNAKEWVPGTCFILKMNVYEPVAQFIYDLIKVNPDNYRYAFVIDSLDGMMKKADLEKSFTDAVQVCGPNVLTKLLFKKVSLPMSELGHLMIVIVQVIAKIEQKYDIKEQMAISGGGGNAAIHFANYILTFQPRYKDGFITSDGAKVTNVDFGETKIIGHWANILLEKTENENSKLKVKYPVLYSADGKEGRIATELEIKKMLTMLGFISSKGAWIYFSENAIAKMKEAGISDVQDKINGENKFNIYISQPEILEFWKSTLSNYMSSKDLL